MKSAPAASVQVGDEGEVGLEAAWREQLGEEGQEESLVKVVVNLASVDGLGEQRDQGVPRHFLRRQVSPTLSHIPCLLISVFFKT